MEIEKVIRQELFNLGIHSNKIGYVYLIEAVKRFSTYKHISEIYEEIANDCGKSITSIRNSIILAINSADHCLDGWEYYDSITPRGVITTIYYKTREVNPNEQY